MNKIIDGKYKKNNRILFYTDDAFYSEVIKTKNCIVCGKPWDEKKFNGEHIIPKWILKKHNLFNQMLVLPNKASFLYNKYKIPCCRKCNSFYGNKLELPISKLLSLGPQKLISNITLSEKKKLFIWLCWIYIKIYLNDRYFRIELNKESNSGMISDLYQWKELHHIYCIARSIYAKTIITKKVIGTLKIFEYKPSSGEDDFDFLDLYEERAILLKTGDVCILAILNDSGLSEKSIERYINKLPNSMTYIQIRELFGRLAHSNHALNQRPKYFTKFGKKNIIDGNIPKDRPTLNISLKDHLGIMLDHCLNIFYKTMANSNKEEIIENIKLGRYTFLFDEDENFIK